MGDMPIQIWADVQEDAGVDTLLLRAWQMSDPGYGRQGHMLCITDGDIVIAPVLMSTCQSVALTTQQTSTRLKSLFQPTR